MAQTSTYTYNDCWSAASDLVQGGNLASKQYWATNKAINCMWQAYDWRGTVAELPPFWLVPYRQDYGTPFYVVPSDFLGLREVYLTYVTTYPPIKRELKVQKYLQESAIQGFPINICYLDAIQGFRVWPLPPTSAASPLYLIDGTYKKQPPKIQRSNLGDLILWPDLYFDTFVDALAWAALDLMGPTKQKDAALQYQKFQRSLAIATGTDALENGPPAVHPSEGLLMPGGWGSNLGYFF